MNNVYTSLLDFYPILPYGMVGRGSLEAILSHLELSLGVPGEVVELGCYAGSTSLFIRRLLDWTHSKKGFRVYDSFDGLPTPTEKDATDPPSRFVKGYIKTGPEILLQNFKDAGLLPPLIQQGFFAEVPEGQFPEKIAFAFLDGDLYESIRDSLRIVVPRISKGGYVCIHDYAHPKLPGVRKACDDYFGGELKCVNGVGIWGHSV